MLMLLFKLLCRVPWLITLSGIAPLAVVLGTGVTADTVAGQPVEMPEPPDPKVESDLRSVAVDAVTARTLLDALDLTQVPNPRPKAPLTGEPEANDQVGATLKAYSHLRLAERFAGRYLHLWKQRSPWMTERKLWQGQVDEHALRGQDLKVLATLTEAAKSRIAALEGLEKGDSAVDQLEMAYADKDYLGAREIGDQLKNELEKLAEDHSKDRDVPKTVEPWLRHVASIIDSSTFLANFLQWKSAFDVRWPRLAVESRELRREWEMSSKPPSFVLARNGIGRLQAEKLDELLEQTGKEMAATRKAMDGVETRMKDTLQRVRTLSDSVPVEDRASLRKDARTSHGQAVKELEQVQQHVDDATRLREQATAAIESHKLATAAWGRYLAAPRQEIPERFQQVGRLLDAFPEAKCPTGMIRQRLQCDMMDWLRGVFREKPLFPDATIQEARLAKSGWLVGRFEDRQPQANYFLYKFKEIDSEGKLEAQSTPIPSFDFYGKAGEFPRQPLTNDLIRDFNASVNRAAAGFDDLRRWSEFAKGCLRLQARLNVYVTVRGGREKLKINRALSFDREVTASGLLVKAAEHLKALFPR